MSDNPVEGPWKPSGRIKVDGIEYVDGLPIAPTPMQPVKPTQPQATPEPIQIGRDGFPVGRPELSPEAQRIARKQIIPAWQVQLNIENTDVVAGIVPRAGLGLIIGKYASAKSFFALHLASCMSRGVEFFGKKVERCGVVYICAESGGSFDRRIVAHHFDKSAALGFIFSSIDFGKPISADVRTLVDQIRAFNDMLDVPVRMIFVDTIARSGLKNENDGEAMAALIENCDMLSSEMGCIVTGIHHQGWEATHSRGHSSLPAAVDFEITLAASGEIFTAKVTKSRDGSSGAQFAFKLDPVKVGTGADGSEITSCLVRPIEGVALDFNDAARQPVRKITIADKAHAELLNCIVDEGKPLGPNRELSAPVQAVTLDAFNARLVRVGVLDKGDAGRQAWKRLKDDLMSRQKIRILDGYVWSVTS